jgi:hypothetical protein
LKKRFPRWLSSPSTLRSFRSRSFATYKLSNINRTKLENIVHRIFEPAQLEIEIKDRFGNPITPREWFLVPVFVIDEAVERIKDGTISNFRYDPKSASLVEDV